MEGYNISNIMTNENQLHHEVVGLAIGLNNFAACDSASRLYMEANHLSQMVVINGAQFRRLYTGIEREYGRATFKAKLPCKAQPIDVIHKFQGGIGQGAIPAQHNPVSYLLYQDLDAAEQGKMILNVLEIPRWHFIHQSYGFRYNVSDSLKRLKSSDVIAKDTVFAQSPNICPETEDYKFGRETTVAYMSVPGIIEDGYIMRAGLAQELKFKAYGKVMFGWGKKVYPLNIYGDDVNYKPFPDVGDVIREDGLLFASRVYDPINAGVEMSAKNLRRVDVQSDKTIYIPPGAKIVDVKIMRNGRAMELVPDVMNEQASKYYNAQQTMANRIKTVCDDFTKQHRNTILGDNLYSLKLDSLIELGEYKKNASKTFRANLIDDWTVIVTYEKEEVPTVGYKITGLHGDKGVICDVWPDDEMPVDKHGTVVDIIKDGDSTIKRMNSGAPYEHYNGASLDEADRRIRKMASEQVPPLEIYAWLLEYYLASSPYHHELINNLKNTEALKIDHVNYVLEKGISVFLPPNSPTIGIDQIRNLEAVAPVDVGPVRYRGRSGRWVTTKSDIMVGSAITIVLEKTGSIWAAVSSARRQHFGFLTKLTNSNKLSLPWRETPSKFTGESEVRLLNAYSDARTVADLLILQNDPNAMRTLIRNRISAPKPTAMPKSVDWDVVGRKGHRGVNHVCNMLACAGIEYGRD